MGDLGGMGRGRGMGLGVRLGLMGEGGRDGDV